MLGHYRLVRRLGAGGMAEVYEAVAERAGGLRQRCVVKRILDTHRGNHDLIKMFVTEARVSAELQHPNIVQILDFGQVEGEPFLAMEHVEGSDLRQVLRHYADSGQLLPIDFGIYVATQVAAALDYAHRRTDARGRPLEIVHRDVTPSNIMITNEGGIKLLDFGIAKAAAHVRDERTRTGSFKGKVSYMSPQQADGQLIDARSDQFSLGIVLYECLTLKRVFRGDDDFQTLRKIREAQVVPPSEIRPEVPRKLDRIVLGMLAREPEDRFASCADVVEELAPLLHALHADARVARAVMATLPPRAEEAEAPATSSGSWSADDAELGLTTTGSHSGVDGTVEAPTGGGTGSLSAPPRTLLRRALIAATATAVLALAVFFAPHQTRLAPSPATSAPVAPLPVPMTAPAAATRAVAPLPSPPRPKVTLDLVGTEGAEVYDGDRLIGTVPVTIDLDAVAGARELVARKAGFVDGKRMVAGDASARVEFHLARRRRAGGRPASDGPEIKDPYAQ